MKASALFLNATSVEIISFSVFLCGGFLSSGLSAGQCYWNPSSTAKALAMIWMLFLPAEGSCAGSFVPRVAVLEGDRHLRGQWEVLRSIRVCPWRDEGTSQGAWLALIGEL